MSILLLILLLLVGLVGRGTSSESSAAEQAPAEPADASQVNVAVEAAPVAAWPVEGVFADPAQLDGMRGDPGVEIVALTPEEDFLAGRIPGAVQVDWPAFEIVETGDQSVASWRTAVEATLTDLAISPSDTVAVYDGGTLYAPRLWWVLRQLGHQDVRILDGGLPAWRAAGLPVDSGPLPVAGRDPGVPYVGTPDETAIATIAEVEAALDDPSVVLVDARTPAEYAEGHIPGAANIPFTANAVEGSGGLWRSPEELRTLYEAAGVTPEMTVIAYCTSGVRSAATFATLTALGYPNVSLFTGSWAEWSADPSRPVEV